MSAAGIVTWQVLLLRYRRAEVLRKMALLAPQNGLHGSWETYLVVIDVGSNFALL